MAKVCGDNAVGFTCAIWRSYYGKELNVRTHYMLGDNRGIPDQTITKKKSGRNSICSETTHQLRKRADSSKPHIMWYAGLFIQLSFCSIRKHSKYWIWIHRHAHVAHTRKLLRSISRHGSSPYLFLWVLQLSWNMGASIIKFRHTSSSPPLPPAATHSQTMLILSLFQVKYWCTWVTSSSIHPNKLTLI